jgi:hypothetical protein
MFKSVNTQIPLAATKLFTYSKMAEQLKILVSDKKRACVNVLKGLNRKRLLVKIMSTSVLMTTLISSATISSFDLPPVATSIISLIIAVMTGINLKFDFRAYENAIDSLRTKLNTITARLEYCAATGTLLTESDYTELCNF